MALIGKCVDFCKPPFVIGALIANRQITRFTDLSEADLSGIYTSIEHHHFHSRSTTSIVIRWTLKHSCGTRYLSSL